MLAARGSDPVADPTPKPRTGSDCAWWDLVCQGGEQVADSGLNALTQATISGLLALFGQITKIVDESTRVPLADPAYRDTYYGFAALAVPLIVAVYLVAVLTAAIRRDPRALTRATVGIAVAAIGGMVYVLFAQILVALDDWMAHGVVSITGADFGQQMARIAQKFELMGQTGTISANLLMLVLMFAALMAGVVLWVVLLLRKIAILVVVAFAPLLIAGWLWPPTRSWSRKATEVLVALVFAKSVIYVIFGIGMSLLLRGSQSLSDFVGVVVLLCGACFAPLVMLKLVHFAADSHLAGEMVGNLRAGAQPVMNKVSTHAPGGGGSRSSMARDYASRPHGSGARGGEATVSGGGPKASAPNSGAAGPSAANGAATGGATAGGSGAGASATSAGAGAGAGGAAAAAGPVGAGVAAGAIAVKGVAKGTKAVATRGGQAMHDLSGDAGTSSGPTSPGPSHDGEE